MWSHSLLSCLSAPAAVCSAQLSSLLSSSVSVCYAQRVSNVLSIFRAPSVTSVRSTATHLHDTQRKRWPDAARKRPPPSISSSSLFLHILLTELTHLSFTSLLTQACFYISIYLSCSCFFIFRAIVNCILAFFWYYLCSMEYV